MHRSDDIGSSHTSRVEKIAWTRYIERISIEFMHEEFVNHRLQPSTFSPSVWARITDRMNSTFDPSYVFNPEQLKGKLNRMHRAWRLLNDLVKRGTERNTVIDEFERLEELCRENSEYKKIVEYGIPHFDLCTQMFARNIAMGGIARSFAQPTQGAQTVSIGDDEHMTVENSGRRRRVRTMRI